MLIMLSIIEDEITRFEIEMLYNKYKKSCFYEAYKILKDEQISFDIVQITFEKLILFLDEHSLNDINHKKGFLITITKREAINYINKADNKRAFFTEDIAKYDSFDEEEPLIKVLQMESANEFLKKLDLINPDYAQLIILKYSKEFSNNEIAMLLGISESYVRLKLTRARREFKKMILDGDKNEG